MEAPLLYTITVPQFSKMLQNLKRILDKGVRFAEAKKIDFEVLLNSRLAPDQFNLIRQIQSACDTAKICAARLCDQKPPVHEDKEKTLPELTARIDEVIRYLESFSTTDFEGAADRKVLLPRWEGKHVTGIEYATQHSLPNFYFHIATAYDILRHNGVEVGKKDYLGDMPLKN